MLLDRNPNIAFGILNWKKPHTPKIIMALAKQRVKPSIRVWNNNPEYRFAEHYPEAAAQCDVIIDSSTNLRCSVFPTLFEDCDCKLIGKIDDDIIPTDDNVIGDCIDYLIGRDPNIIIGERGVVLQPGKQYKDCGRRFASSSKDIKVDIVLSRFWVFHKSALWKAPRTATNHHGDVSLCGFLANGQKQFHTLPSILYNRLESLEEYGLGSWHQSGHIEAREKERVVWFSE